MTFNQCLASNNVKSYFGVQFLYTLTVIAGLIYPIICEAKFYFDNYETEAQEFDKSCYITTATCAQFGRPDDCF